jgi:Ca-activated chloride channel family protein
MRRWMLTTSLGGAAVLAAMLIPDLQAALSTSPAPAPNPAPEPLAAPAPTGPTGSLAFSARLDQGTLLAGSEEDRFLVITVTAPEAEHGRRVPVDVAVVMDCSGSMSGWHKMDYARLAARELVGSLQPGDRVSLVGFSDRARVLLPAQEVGADKSRILSAIDRIQEGGGTNMHAGLTSGLEQLRAGGEGYVERILLLSDGHANVGVSDSDSLASLTRQASVADVSTSTIGLGLDFNEDLLATMADAGGGTYHFVDQAQQLAAIFGDELDAMTHTVARDVTVRMDLPPGVSVVDTYGYTDTHDGESWRVYLGDIHAGQERKIVVRLDHPSADEGTLQLADVTLDYADLDLDLDIHRAIALDAPVTRNAARAQASLDHETAVKAARAQAADLADQAARAFQANDRSGAQASLHRTAAILRKASEELAAPELLEDEADYLVALPAYKAASPASEEGLRAVKSQKEVSRGYAY